MAATNTRAANITHTYPGYEGDLLAIVVKVITYKYPALRSQVAQCRGHSKIINVNFGGH